MMMMMTKRMISDDHDGDADDDDDNHEHDDDGDRHDNDDHNGDDMSSLSNLANVASCVARAAQNGPTSYPPSAMATGPVLPGALTNASKLAPRQTRSPALRWKRSSSPCAMESAVPFSVLTFFVVIVMRF